MNNLITYNQKAVRISQQNGVNIPVHQLNHLARVGGRATNSFINSLTHDTYQERDFVLGLVHRSLYMGREYKEAK